MKVKDSREQEWSEHYHIRKSKSLNINDHLKSKGAIKAE